MEATDTDAGSRDVSAATFKHLDDKTGLGFIQCHMDLQDLIREKHKVCP
jgi:hypothetical protein